ncbi:hypothetical protein C5167_016772 [Papaver somniferum]|uniref:dynein light chain 2, cytoplasmic-like n=1 Tax=Papaver somniferum TaxID=3469 RepID=UPI000E7044CE|nr:dynein light chain 2, cytoplasmic-like [Papaver somniferum]RZC94074.1 hypothetical protein C5167_016772 [Papaver somniferum]
MSEEKRRNGNGGGVLYKKVSPPPSSSPPPPPPPPQPLDEKRSSSTSSSEKTSTTTKKAIIKSADMKEDLQKEAIEFAISAFQKHNVEKDIAEYIKKEFDKKHGPTWHCIVGRNFGSYVTHETNHFVYFYLDQKAILLFKSG